MPHGLLFGVAVALSLVIASRPFGVDRDYDAYRLYFERNDEQGARLDSTPFGVTWRWMYEFGFNFVAALVGTTWLALQLKLAAAWRTSYPGFFVLAYGGIFLLLLEFTQIRLAVSIGFLALFATRLRVCQRVDAKCAGWALLATSIHPSVIGVPLALLAWTWLGLHPRSMLVVSAALLFTPIEFVELATAALHGEIPEDYFAGGAPGSFNPLSARNLVLVLVLAISAANVYQMAVWARPMVGIAVAYLALGYGLREFPTFAHRLTEIALFLPLLWLDLLPLRAKQVCMGAYLVLATIMSALFLADPTFFVQ